MVDVIPSFFLDYWSELVASVLAIALVAGGIVLATRSNLLRDVSAANHRPFSFSRVQLLWWVMVVALCVLYGFGKNGELDPLNLTAMALMGLGLGTSTLAQVINGRQRSVAVIHGTTLSQDEPSEGFFTDILSDESGVSVHRLQSLVFNVIYGIGFFAHYVRTGQFQEYGEFEFMVLGISSAGYLALKSMENDPKSQAAISLQRPGGDELADADAAPSGPAASG